MESMDFLILAWLLYYALHSLLASMSLKRWVQNRLPGLYPSYRLIYNAIAILGLGGIVFLHLSLPGKVLIEGEMLPQIMGGLLGLGGVVLGLLALKQYDLGAFSGIKPLPDQVNQAEEPFVRVGLNAYMRHPLYTAIILFLVGLFLLIPTTNMLISCSMGLLYLPLGIFFEEKKLLEIYGETYAAYRKEVPMLFPRVRRYKGHGGN